MDHERFLEQIVGWATANDNIRVVVLTGSAALGPEHMHALSDLDVELYVAQPIMLLDDDAWYAQFGEVLVVESLPNPGWYPTRLVYYIDGKIDFMVEPVDALATVRYVRSFGVLLDKDHAADALPPVEPLATDPPSVGSSTRTAHLLGMAAFDARRVQAEVRAVLEQAAG